MSSNQTIFLHYELNLLVLQSTLVQQKDKKDGKQFQFFNLKLALL